MRCIAGALIFGLANIAHADSCREYLAYTDQERSMAALDVLTNAEPTKKLTIAIMLAEACQGKMSDFPRAEANKDAAVFLPYLRSTRAETSKGRQ